MKKLHARVLLIVAAVVVCLSLPAQSPVNAYARVTGIAGTVLNLSNVSETFDTFEDGEYVIIAQMQDDVIGANTTNAATFGNLSAIASAGLYEVAMISTHTESGGLPNTVTLSSALSNTYNTGANSRVQLISFPVLGSPNYTSPAAGISATAWNGNTGGVIAFWVQGTLTLGGNITANASGFRGGLENAPNGYSACDNTTYRNASTLRYAFKGEGIYLATNAAYACARGKILNGGGGGNDVNAGGGGGGNYSAGGNGGIGWTPAGTGCSPGVGGLGGISLSAQISASRVFMGGGGGGGHENDNLGSPGGAGGGIIFIKANSIATSGSCAGRSITANGANAANAANDGGGGGGAGGSIVLQVGSYSVAGTCALAISANGGNGGSSVTTGAHGGGGGGGQGAIIFSGAQPVTNVTTSSNVGTGGTSCSGCPAASNGVSGTGPNNSGIIPSSSGPLPIELLTFTGHLNGNQVDLEWTTASEHNNDYFILERSDDFGTLTEIATIDGAGNSTGLLRYAHSDLSPQPGMNYYRLRQHDFNGELSYSNWVSVLFQPGESYVKVYPNPASGGELSVEMIGFDEPEALVRITDLTGRIVDERSMTLSGPSSIMLLSCSDCPAGLYNVQLITVRRTENIKVVFR